MTTLKELKAKTGYGTFLAFKRQCVRSSDAVRNPGWTKYQYDGDKVVELDIKSEELFMMADREIAEGRKTKPVKNKISL